MSTLLGNSNIWLEKWNKERKKRKNIYYMAIHVSKIPNLYTIEETNKYKIEKNKIEEYKIEEYKIEETNKWSIEKIYYF